MIPWVLVGVVVVVLAYAVLVIGDRGNDDYYDDWGNHF